MCYKKAGPTVADALQTDQQRLVVYLYKDANNNLKVYTPKKEKQLLLPDLGIEKDDALTYVGPESEQVQQLFDSNNAVKSQTKVVTSNTNLNNQYSSVKESSNSEVLQVLDLEKENSQFQDQSYDQEVLDNSDDSVVPTSDPEVSQVVVAEGPEVDVDSPTVDPSVDTDQGVNFVNSHDDDVGLPVIPVLDDTSVPANPAVVDEESAVDLETQDELNTPVLQESDKVLTDDDQSLDDTFEGSHLTEASSLSFNKEKLKVVSPKNSNLLQDSDLGSNLQLLQADESSTRIVNSKVDGESVPLNPAHPLNELYTTRYEYVTFDHWFNQQMQRMQNIGQSPNKNFDLSSLKQQLEKTLYENGMFVTKDGVLIDYKGDALDVDNIKLRPILIGDSVAYNTVFAVNDGYKYELPSNLPYLEAVLVTLVNPPKILGVIPLGKTYVPRVSYRRNFDYWDLKSSCTLGTCQPQQLHPKSCPSATCGHYELRPLSRPQSFSFRSGNVKKLVTNKLNSKKKVPALPPSYRTHGKKGINYLPKALKNIDVKQILKALYDLDKHTQHKYKVGSSKSKGRNHDRKQKTTKQNNNDEVPWFRIIGGNPATSSGTPVSSKGRSGNPYY